MKKKNKKNKKKKQGSTTGFELATSKTVDKRCIHYATNIIWVLHVHITF